MNTLYELNYMDTVIKKITEPYRQPIEPAMGYLLIWESCYSKGRENRLNSLGWLFANEYYRAILDGEGL